jgi:hypothetical protein
VSPALAAHGGLWLATLAPAATVAVTPGAAATARSALNFPLQPSPPSLNEAAQIALTNARVTGAILLAAFTVTRCHRARALLDVALLAVVAPNAVMVGVALGAYGPSGLPWLVHLPLEWAALATALTAYVTARRRTLPARDQARRAAAVGVLVVVGALAESLLTPR